MDCFYHEGKAAVALCRYCTRGVCHDCAYELAIGVACKGRCEENGEMVTQLAIRNIRANTGRLPFNASAYAVFGLFFVVLGAFMLSVADEARGVVMGVAFLAVAGICLLTAWRFLGPARS
jgi:hypothetical protein